jgi:Ca-activated chloride channel family protein
MKFLWPQALWLLLVLPAAVAAYIAVVRRKGRSAVRYAGLALLPGASGPGPRFRRHLPPALFLVALALAIVAIARPVAVVTLPSQQETVILAMDVSGSMRATDVKPTRIAAAQEAARAFVADAPRTMRIGVVAFAATASVVQPPTQSREDVVAAIDRFQLQRGTAIGSGVLIALKTIFPTVEIDLRGQRPRAQSLDPPHDAGQAPPKPVAPGSYPNAAIILLSDGQATTGPDPAEAARVAAERGVRVFTIGIGTPAGEVLGVEGWSMRVRLDEEALKSIASVTRGEYYRAETAQDLKQVYRALNSRIAFEKRETEVGALFAAAAAVVATLSAALSLLWFNRLL